MNILDINIHPNKKEHYQIKIGKNLLSDFNKIYNLSIYTKVAIVTDTNLDVHLNMLCKHLNFSPTIIKINPGEINKNLNNIENIWKTLIINKFDRKSLLINLGGGVISDLGGFAASTYMRGIDFVNIPTTLLAQVDASIGGKTGFDFQGIKNLIGTFNHPKFVLIDIQTLNTLPQRELNSGYGEIIKHGLIQNAKYFKSVSSKSHSNLSESEIISLISESCKIKKDIVEGDSTENGKRKLLNFGHTIGHAIESISLKSTNPILHGEAISLGIIAEAKISQLVGNISSSDFVLIKTCIIDKGLPTNFNFDLAKVLKKITKDKKNESHTINWTLLKKIGHAEYNQIVDNKLVIEALKSIS